MTPDPDIIYERNQCQLCGRQEVNGVCRECAELDARKPVKITYTDPTTGEELETKGKR